MKRLSKVIPLLILCLFALPALASTGIIDATYHFAWNDNGGWVNWGPTNGNVSVTATVLTGYIWSADFGWINLAPTEGGVTNDGQGALGGYAWGANTGWISFSDVTIDTNGVFHGHTVAQNVFGTMTFDCVNCKVATSWRPTTSGGSSGVSGGGGAVSGPLSIGYENASTTERTPDATLTPSALVPTSKPSKTPPTTKRPSSPKSSAYTSQQVPTSHTVPTSTIQTSQKSSHTTTAPATIRVAQTCSWIGACLWHSVVGFFMHLFGW
jgi:hypothetical protein